MLYLEVSNVTEKILAHLLEFLSLGRGILVEHSDPVEVVKVEASLVQSLGRHVVTSAASLNHLFQINLTDSGPTMVGVTQLDCSAIFHSGL